MVLPLVWNFAAGGRDGHKAPVLLVGGGEVAATRVVKLLAAGDVEIFVVAPELSPQVAELAREGQIHWDQRNYEESDLTRLHWHIVLTAIPDAELSRHIVYKCRELRVPVNAADIPDLCDFFFGAQFSDGPLQVLISTGGAAPQVAKSVRDSLQECAKSLNAGPAIERAELLRAAVREALPGLDRAKSNIRMANVRVACKELSLVEIANLSDDGIVNFASSLENEPTPESCRQRLGCMDVKTTATHESASPTTSDPPGSPAPTKAASASAPAWTSAPDMDLSIYEKVATIPPGQFWSGLHQPQNYLLWKSLPRRNVYCPPVSHDGRVLPIKHKNLGLAPYPWDRTD